MIYRKREKFCLICDFRYEVTKKNQLVCSSECRQIYNGRVSTRERAFTMRGKPRGSGYSYVKYMGKHQHRAVIEAAIGRKLRSDEVVHHIDGNKKNNDLSNLEVMSQAEHARRHAMERPRCQVEKCKAFQHCNGFCAKHNLRYTRSGKKPINIDGKIYEGIEKICYGPLDNV